MDSYNFLHSAKPAARPVRLRPAMVALFAALTLLLCGCSAWIAIFEAEDEPSVPVSAAVKAPDPTPSPAAEIGNPVAAFYSRFNDYIETPVSKLFSRLTSENAIDAMLALMRLSSHNSELTSALVSAGRLSSGGGNYYDTLFEAAKGTGSIAAEGDGRYTFTFLYTEGSYMKGELLQSSISYTVWDADGETVSHSYIRESEAGWLSFVDKDGERSVMRCTGGEAWFSHFDHDYAYEYEPPQSAEDEDEADSEADEDLTSPSPSPTAAPSPSPVPGWYGLVDAEACVYSTLVPPVEAVAGD